MAQLLTKKREKWLTERQAPPVMKGLPLLYPEITAQKYASQIAGFFEAMHADTEKQVLKLLKQNPINTPEQNITATQDALSLVSRARILLNRLRRKYIRIFNRDFAGMVEKMLKQADQASKSNVHASLKELSGGLTVKTDFLTGEMAEQFKALTVQNVSLFKTITSNHFQKVETAVMDSITKGQGLKDLQDFFQSYSTGEKNYAKNRALDQTRKAYAEINMSRLKKLGVKKVRWVHSHGSNAPRKSHQEMDGKIYDIDNPPVVAVMYGQEVRGFGGVAINCRCTVIPVIEF
jgi:SPP1 gp7 family putative phage head morphogenesis protein